jgi:HSP20 family molecular chaperone IbpA
MTMDLLTSIPVRVIGFESTPQLLDNLRERIAHKAYLNFMDRGAVDGHDLDDWLRAEHQLIIRTIPNIKAEADDVFVELELPEVELSNLTVRLSPRQLLISSDPDDQGVQFFQTIDLPVEISMDGVDAEQSRNILHITAAAVLPRPEGQMAASRCA